MCGGGDGGAEATAQQSASQFQWQQEQAAIAAAKEAKRQADIKSGMGQIGDIYAGYDQGYYDNIANDYTNNYAKPQIALQQENDMRQAKFAQARSGLTVSSAAAKQFGDIALAYGQAATDAAARGQQIAQERRGQVEGSRRAAVAQLQSAEDPIGTMPSAQQAVTAYTASPAALAITDLLTSAANQASRAYANNIISGGSSGGSPLSFFRPNSAGGRGTAKVISS